jgi:hypothetical protein
LPPKQVQISYIKSTVSPVLHADGMFGGPTPYGLLYMAFFAEHAKLPDTIQYAVDGAAKTLTPVNQPNQQTGWVREVGGEVIMSLDVARSLRSWLNDQITILERRRPEDVFTSVEEQH